MTRRTTFSRRRLLRAAGGAMLAVAASPALAVPVVGASSDPWLEPFAALRTVEVIGLGRAVLSVDPTLVRHARNSLSRPHPSGPQAALAEACRTDAVAARFVDVDGWRLPATLGGLAAALAG